jgi:small subunit ribosomal protein S14
MAKKSMIEREKKRIRLEKKYAIKRTALLLDYQNEQNFNKKLEFHSKITKTSS